MKIKVFLTKSNEVAQLIAKAYRPGDDKDVKTVSAGFAKDHDIIPEIYHHKGYYYCAVQFESNDEQYELVIA